MEAYFQRQEVQRHLQTTGDEVSKKIGTKTKSILSLSKKDIWVLLENDMVDYYCHYTGVKKENVTPELRRAMCAGHSYSSAACGTALEEDPESIRTWMSPNALIGQANWVIENRLKKSLGN